jgi:hypothetical protein
MKRRLSISISLAGNPAIVFLDEPSTGYYILFKYNLAKEKNNKKYFLIYIRNRSGS